MFQRMKAITREVKREMDVYRLVLAHPHTPRLAKILLGAALGYLLLPFDLIPDAIPLFGQLDDLLIVPGLVLLARRMIPTQVMAECRENVANKNAPAD